MIVLLHPTYFPNIAQMVALVSSSGILFEINDNYTKQTYRNRTYIYGANGTQSLSIPVQHTQKNRQQYKEVKIADESNWQLHHWKTLKSAYNNSPFFEFYEDELHPLFKSTTTYLMDFNFICLEVVCNCLQHPLSYSKTIEYSKYFDKGNDLRHLVNCKKDSHIVFSSYTQVFNNKFGCIPNLSILDLLFNEGPNALDYLKTQSLEKILNC